MVSGLVILLQLCMNAHSSISAEEITYNSTTYRRNHQIYTFSSKYNHQSRAMLLSLSFTQRLLYMRSGFQITILTHGQAGLFS